MKRFSKIKILVSAIICLVLVGLIQFLFFACTLGKQNPEETKIFTSIENQEKIIVIDPGHGSSANARENEGKIELEIGLKLKAMLEQNGYQVIMTHQSIGETIGGAQTEYDDNVSRAEIANKAKADLIIRLHSDAHTQDKFAIYYPQKQIADRNGKIGPKDASAIKKSELFANELLESMKSSGFSPMDNPIHPDTDSQWDANFVFSSNLEVPAAIALIELFGHNDPNLVKKYSNPSEQSKLAKALSNAIVKYLITPN